MKATEVTAGPEESNGSLLPGIWRDSLHVTCGLTACIPGSAPGPTLGNEYGKTLPFYCADVTEAEYCDERFCYCYCWCYLGILGLGFLPARRYALAGTSYGPVSVCVCRKLVFCEKGWTD